VRQIQAADERVAKLEDELAGEQATLAANQGEQEILRAVKDDVAKRGNEAIEQLNELRLTVATERQRYEYLIAQRQPMSARDAELVEAIAARQAEIINFEKRLTTQAEESRTAESAIEKQTGQRAVLEGALASLIEQRRERSTTMNEAESNLRTIRTQLDNMGPVNLDAVHEYDELEERYNFLETQNNDLTNSRRELLDVIAQINSTTKKLFSETFAQVRIHFREMFEELFGGGRADLSLLNENDPLNCGIEISAKPPGKQLQSVSLLSGGE